MAVFLISYNLRKPSDSTSIYAALKNMRAKQLQDSVWCIRTNDPVTIVFDNLSQHMHHETDSLIVVTLDKEQAYITSKLITPLKDI